MVSVSGKDVGLPSSLLLGGSNVIVISLFRPKTRRYMGRRQFALIEDPATIAWLTWWIDGLDPQHLVFPGSRAELNNLLKEATQFLGLQELHLVLAGLRTGGATHAFRKHRNIGRLQFAGRWRSSATLQHYLQEAMTAHLVTVLPQRVQALLESLAPRIEQIRFPPPALVNQLVGWRGAGHGRTKPS